MADIDIDSLSDDEVEAYIAEAESKKWKASERELAGGASFELSIVMLVTGLAGMWASFSLVTAERAMLQNPGGKLSCDLNPLIGCSGFFNSDYNTLFFGAPNALFGLMFFSGVVALGLALLGGARLPSWMWRLLSLGMAAAAAWIFWFQYTSIFVEGALCPYCIVTWAATIPLIVHVLARSFGAGHLPAGDGVRRILVKGRWWLVAAVYLAVVLVAVVALWDKWEYVF